MRAEKTVRIEARLEDVWRAFNDWGGIYKFQPFVVSSPLLSDNNEGVGASRRCSFVDDTSIVETVTKVEPMRLIEMSLSETPKPMKSGTAAIELRRVGEKTDVTVHMDVQLGLGPLNPIMGNLMMKPMMKKRITAMLESLEYHLQTGGKIDAKGQRIHAVRAVG